jgi:hypothetical protein
MKTLTRITDEKDIEKLGLRQAGGPVAAHVGAGSEFDRDVVSSASRLASERIGSQDATHFMYHAEAIEAIGVPHCQRYGEGSHVAYAFVFYAPKNPRAQALTAGPVQVNGCRIHVPGTGKR